jgi:hypothetical protein
MNQRLRRPCPTRGVPLHPWQAHHEMKGASGYRRAFSAATDELSTQARRGLPPANSLSVRHYGLKLAPKSQSLIPSEGAQQMITLEGVSMYTLPYRLEWAVINNRFEAQVSRGFGETESSSFADSHNLRSCYMKRVPLESKIIVQARLPPNRTSQLFDSFLKFVLFMPS